MSPARLHFITEKEGEKRARCPTIIMAVFFFTIRPFVQKIFYSPGQLPSEMKSSPLARLFPE